MLEKKYNEFRLDIFPGNIQDAYDDVISHPDSEYREEEITLLVNLVYFEGFRDGLRFMEWLNDN